MHSMVVGHRDMAQAWTSVCPRQSCGLPPPCPEESEK